MESERNPDPLHAGFEVGDIDEHGKLSPEYLARRDHANELRKKLEEKNGSSGLTPEEYATLEGLKEFSTSGVVNFRGVNLVEKLLAGEISNEERVELEGLQTYPGNARLAELHKKIYLKHFPIPNNKNLI